MKILLDLLPAIVFFTAYKLSDIYYATGIAMVVAAVSIAFTLVRRQPARPVQWLSLAFIAVFGSLTILLHDEYYIKVKWTLFYGLMGLLMLGAVVLKKNPLKSLLGQELELPEAVWRQLSIGWGIFFWLMAGLNQYFATVLSLDAWMNVKLFGGTAVTFVFAFLQALWLAKHLPDEEAVEPPGKGN